MGYLVPTYITRLSITATRPFNQTVVAQGYRCLTHNIIQHFKSRAEAIEYGNTNVAKGFADARDIEKYLR